MSGDDAVQSRRKEKEGEGREREGERAKDHFLAVQQENQFLQSFRSKPRNRNRMRK
jgi:hypothetical protein